MLISIDNMKSIVGRLLAAAASSCWACRGSFFFSQGAV